MRGCTAVLRRTNMAQNIGIIFILYYNSDGPYISGQSGVAYLWVQGVALQTGRNTAAVLTQP